MYHVHHVDRVNSARTHRARRGPLSARCVRAPARPLPIVHRAGDKASLDAAGAGLRFDARRAACSFVRVVVDVAVARTACGPVEDFANRARA